MSVRIDVEGLDGVLDGLEDFDNGIKTIGEGLLHSVETNLLPDLEEASASVWNVSTGAYSNSWYAVPVGSESVVVANPVVYAAPLEFGWTARNGRFVSSPGVLFPTVLNRMDSIRQGLVEWLMNHLGL